MPETGRRNFVLGVLGAFGAVIALGYAVVAERFMLPPPESASTMQKVGSAGDFALNDVKLFQYTGDGGFPDGVYVVQLAKGFAAYDEHCAHLQCPVQWSAGPQEFLCPCHGSVYDVTGKNIAGPAPHPLDFHHITVDANNDVYVGGIIPWGTPAWTAMARSLGLLGKWVPGDVPGTMKWMTIE